MFARYVNCTSMAARSVEAVRKGDLKIVPEFHEATWYRWLENIRWVIFSPLSVFVRMIFNSRDWCVSRQLWWGHRIPAYFARVAGEVRLDKNEPGNASRWVVARTPADAKRIAAEKLSVSEETIELEQDEDVLDTWFR